MTAGSSARILAVVAAGTLAAGCGTKPSTSGAAEGSSLPASPAAPAPNGSATPSGTPGGGASPVVPSPSATATPAGSATPAAASTPAAAGCQTLAAGLSQAEQVGQLFMVGTEEVSASDDLREVVQRTHAGSVIYLGTQPRSLVGTRRMSDAVAAWGSHVPVLLAADQEGGQVQRLAGEGFAPIPSATRQAGLADTDLTLQWQRWGGQLKRAGVRYDLAPVSDVVPPGEDADNDAVGAMDRNYGTTRAAVGRKAAAVVRGLRQAGVASSLKHYPGLGRASVNTDFGVATDTRTTASDVADFAPAMAAGASSVMISSTIYQRIDPGVPGVFSRRIITGLLRGQQGWQGVVISDDLGAAASVASVPAGQRALRFLTAGGDLVVDADPVSLQEMVDAVLRRAQRDPAFARQVTAHATRVLALKQSVGLVRCGS